MSEELETIGEFADLLLSAYRRLQLVEGDPFEGYVASLRGRIFGSHHDFRRHFIQGYQIAFSDASREVSE